LAQKDDEGDEGDWSAVWALRWLGTREVLDRALSYTRSEDPRLRGRGADILGQLGIPDRTFPEPCFDAIGRLLKTDIDIDVIYSAAVAMGHLGHPHRADVLVPYASHADRDIRQAVATALGGDDSPLAIATLLRLTQDDDPRVRDWATFGLGAMTQVNTPEIRAALHNRLSDDDPETRFEAVCGLARCRDLRVLPILIDWFAQDLDNSFLNEAAARMLGLDWSKEANSIALLAMLRALPAP
jgi:HEAT repeat protein